MTLARELRSPRPHKTSRSPWHPAGKAAPQVGRIIHWREERPLPPLNLRPTGQPQTRHKSHPSAAHPPNAPKDQRSACEARTPVDSVASLLLAGTANCHPAPKTAPYCARSGWAGWQCKA